MELVILEWNHWNWNWTCLKLSIFCLTHAFIWMLTCAPPASLSIFLVHPPTPSIHLPMNHVCLLFLILSSQFASPQDASYLYLTINPLLSFQPPHLSPLPAVIEPTSRLLVLPVSLLKYLKRSGDGRAGCCKPAPSKYSPKICMQNQHLRCLRQRNNNLRYQVISKKSTFSTLVKQVFEYDSLLHARPYSLIFPVTLMVCDLMKQEYLWMILKTIIKY